MIQRRLIRILIVAGAALLPLSAIAEPVVPRGTLAERGQSALGLVVFTILAGLIGRLRGARKIPWRVVTWGTILSFVFGAMVIFSPEVLQKVQLVINKLLDFSNEGSHMVFGNLIANPVNVTKNQDGGAVVGYAQIGFVFAFSVLPTIIFIAMLTAVFYHIGILTWVVHGL